MNARDKAFEKAQTAVAFKAPFFGPAVARLPVKWDTGAVWPPGDPNGTPTACTDGQCIRWHPDFFDKLTDGQRVTLLVHEAAHCLLGHVWRAPAGADWSQWNIACDHAVNLMLKDFSEMTKARNLADPFPFPDPPEAYCADPAFKGMAEEVIFARMPKPQKGGGGGGGGGGGKPGKPGKPSQGSMPAFGQMDKPAQSGQTPEQQKALHNDWDGTLLQSARIAKAQGTMPGCIDRLVEQVVNPRVAWRDILRSWIREQISQDWDFLKPALEFEGSGFIMPGMSGERCGPVVFATDTSGSIDQQLLSAFQAEKQNCLDDMKPSKLVDVYCDARIHKVEEFTPGDVITLQSPGGGGTDFRPVFEHVEKMPEPPKALIYLTDLWGSFPEVAPAYPVIWVTWTKDGTAPFGTVVYVGD